MSRYKRGAPGAPPWNAHVGNGYAYRRGGDVLTRCAPCEDPMVDDSGMESNGEGSSADGAEWAGERNVQVYVIPNPIPHLRRVPIPGQRCKTRLGLGQPVTPTR